MSGFTARSGCVTRLTIRMERRRQVHGKGRALARLARDPDAPAHRFGVRLADVQAKAETRSAFLWVEPPEALEEPLLLLTAESRPLIMHMEAYPQPIVANGRLCPHLHHAAVRRVADGIAEQV